MSGVGRKVILVTGGTRGVGDAIARALTDHGAQTISTTRNPSLPSSAKVSTRIEVLDVTNEASVRGLFAKIKSEYGRLDVLINNAGVGVFKPLEETTHAEWKEVLDTNLTGAVLCAREAFGLMREQGGGRIINIGSIADYMALPSNAAYAASKFGLRGLSGVINEEGKELGIFSTLLSLGAVYTEIWKDRPGFDASAMLPLSAVADAVLSIVTQKPGVRLDEMKLLPPKGVL